MNTAEIMIRLQSRYSLPEWAFFEQVRDIAGFGASRTADAVAMNLWPGRGLELHGFEVKATRADWRRELKDPAKAEAVSQFCDRWWIVVGDKDIVKDDELPPTWGLLVCRGKTQMVAKVKAPKLDPTPIDRHFFAVLLKKASASKEHGVTEARVKTLVDAGRPAIEKRIQESMNWKLEMAEREVRKWEEAVQKFEDASGVKLDVYSSGQIGEAVKTVLALKTAGWESVRSRLDRTAEDLTRLATTMTNARDQLGDVFDE